MIGLPVAALVVMLTVDLEADRAAAGFVLAAAWVLALLSRARPRRLVAVGVLAESVFGLGWVVVVWFLATPCALSGRGILMSTSQCPVQATHFVSAVVGGASCVALAVAAVAGLRYARHGDDGALRRFRNALVIAATLILVLLVSDAVLPRNHPSD